MAVKPTLPIGTLLRWTDCKKTTIYPRDKIYRHICLLLCNGGTRKRKRFPLLFNIMGTVWGKGDGRTTFNLPNYRPETWYIVADGRKKGG